MATLKPVLRGIDKDSGHAGARRRRLHAERRHRRTRSRYFEKAAALDPKHTGKRTAVALAHLRNGEHRARPARSSRQAAGADTGTRADLALIATYAAQQRKSDKALAAIDALEKKQPDKPLPRTCAAACCWPRDDPAGARKSFERALELDPGYFPAAANLARLDIADKKPDEAKKRFEAVLAKDPKNVAAPAWRSPTCAPSGAAGRRSRRADRQGDRRESDGRRPHGLRSIDHYLRNKDTNKAVAAAQEALAVLPDVRSSSTRSAARSVRPATPKQAMTTYRKLAQTAYPARRCRTSAWPRSRSQAEGQRRRERALRKALAIKPDYVEAQRRPDRAGPRMPGACSRRWPWRATIQKQRPKQAVGYVLEGDIHASQKAWKEAHRRLPRRH